MASIISLSRTHAGSANLGETQAFMDDIKRILVFSDASGTGRSYLAAELSAKNRSLRIHYLLEAGVEGRCRNPRAQPHQPGAIAANLLTVADDSPALLTSKSQ